MTAHGLELRYMAIDWAGPGVPSSLEIAPEPIEIEAESDGSLVAETLIFNDKLPWVGLRLTGYSADTRPAFIGPDGSRKPLRAIDTDKDGRWWIEDDGWDESAGRHLSSLHRTAGRFVIEAGPRRLTVDNQLGGAGDLQLYLDDFKQEFVWLAMTGRGVAGGGLAIPDITPFIEALDAFSIAVRRVAENPAVQLSEALVEAPVSRVKPNQASFRQHLRRPSAPRLIGRGVLETADTPENRYIRHMIAVCRRLCASAASAHAQTAQRLSRMAEHQAHRAHLASTMRTRPVDPEIFDRQTEDVRERINDVTSFSDCPDGDGPTEEFRLALTGVYRSKYVKAFFCRPPRLSPAASKPASFHLAQFPEVLFDRLKRAKQLCRDYVITARVVVDERITQAGKPYLVWRFRNIVTIQPATDPLRDREVKRRRLEQNGWVAHLSSGERQELAREAKSAANQAAAWSARSQALQDQVATLRRILGTLDTVYNALRVLGVRRSDRFPTGMRFTRNPRYASSWGTYRKTLQLAERGGLSLETLDRLETLTVLHSSALYERWSLIKIISVLMESYGFEPVPREGWLPVLVDAVMGGVRGATVQLHRPDVGITARLELQVDLPNGRRPDFRLRFEQNAGAGEVRHGLILDAKFRTSWRWQGLDEELSHLLTVKDYGDWGDRVFILQPVPKQMDPVRSPLSWGRHCDYGHHEKKHRSGLVLLCADPVSENAISHLKRLIALQLQSVFHTPSGCKNASDDSCHASDRHGCAVECDAKTTWAQRAFCIQCGKKHEASDVIQLSTKSGEAYWRVTCGACHFQVTQTHCFGCSHRIYKNGTELTYHGTLADQVTNVICPSCGEYFDAD